MIIGTSPKRTVLAKTAGALYRLKDNNRFEYVCPLYDEGEVTTQ